VNELTRVFGTLALLALVAAGLVMMFAPAAGRQMLKNVFFALGLFVVASFLLQASCSALSDAKRDNYLTVLHGG
jgi:type IV secretory pathway VirB2 component (pilin)